MKQATCACGKRYAVNEGPGRRSPRCPDCRAERNREIAREFHSSQREGGRPAVLRARLKRLRGQVEEAERELCALTGGKYA